MTKIKSNLSNRDYSSYDNIRILNAKQAAYYWENGVEPLDIYLGSTKLGEPVVVFIFSKKKLKKLVCMTHGAEKETINYEESNIVRYRFIYY